VTGHEGMRARRLRLDFGAGPLAVAWTEWGPPEASRTVVCVHGLTRNARDFDVLAARLAAGGARVLCVDVVGRGASDWLPDPRAYRLETYVRQLRALLERLAIGEVDWIGTSMGGLVALRLSVEDPHRIRRLVLNDIGPYVAAASLAPIRSYLGLDLSFADLDALEAHLRTIHAGFGPLSDAQWGHLARHGARVEGGRLRLHYDPAIRVPFLEETAADLDLWPAYDALSCPVLVLRGAESPVLDPATALAMAERGPRARLAVFAGVGHAPALMSADQIETVAGWLGH